MKNHLRSSRRTFLAAGSCLAAVANLPGQEPAENRKRIYIAADDHTDYMWTADEDEYRRAFLKMLDHYLDLADQTENDESDFQSRWNCDGLLWFREFQQNRSKQETERLVRRIKSGHISIPMTVLVSCYGGAPTEAVLRGLYYGGHFERKYDLRLRIAVSMENQTLPYGLGLLWAGSGVRYSWKGICSCATKLESPGSREHDVYWWVGPDGSRILMKWYSLGPRLSDDTYPNEGPGGYAEARSPRLAIEYVDTNEDFRRRNPHSVIGLFGQGWDDLVTRIPLRDPKRSFPVVAKAMTNKNRRVIVSDENDYFADMEKTHGKDLPEVRAAFGNEWDLYSASLAEVSASVKRATEKLRAAEAMASLVSSVDPDFAKDLSGLRDRAWIAYGLYWEHDWTADGPVSRERRATWQRKIAKQIIDYVDTLHTNGRKKLGELIRFSNSNAVFVFNPLGWKRTDVVEFQLKTLGEFEAFDVVTQKPVPSQTVSRDGNRYLRFLAADVPAIGYRVFRFLPRSTKQKSSTVSLTNDKLDSKQHRLSLRPDGSLCSWTWKRIGRELIGDSQVANRIAGGAGQWSIESTGPVSTTVRVDIHQPLARTTRITLYEELGRIDIENTITQNFDDVLSWRYDFQFDQPKTYHEEVGAVLDAAFQSNGGDYADRNSRTDWLTLNHFVAMHDDSCVVTLSASDCQFFHLGDDTSQQMDSRSNSVHALAGGQVDGPKLGIPSQGRDKNFLQRFSLSMDRFQEAKSRGQSMRAALEHQNPLVVGEVASGKGVLPSDEFSFLSVDSDQVIVWAVKPSEEGIQGGLIVRLWNLADQERDYALSCNWPVGDGVRKLSRCLAASHVETDAEEIAVRGGTVTERVPPRTFRTLRCF